MHEEKRNHESYSSAHFQKDLSIIHASEELKYKTKKYINQKAEKKTEALRHPILYIPVMLSILLLITIGTSVFHSYRTPVTTISVDVNPSLELKLNSWDYVIEAIAYNKEGQKIIEALPLCNKRIETSISSLLENTSFSQYLKENADLTFTVVSKEKTNYEDILKNQSSSVTDNVMILKSDENTLKEAHKHHLSVGKYNAYKQLASYDTSIKIEDCRHMTMHEIHSMIQEHCNDEKSEKDETHTSNNHQEDISIESNDTDSNDHEEEKEKNHHETEDHSSHHHK